MSANFLAQIEDIVLAEASKMPPPSAAFLKGGEVWRRQYRLPADLLVFQGHFAANPVLPALAQVLMAKDAARRLSGLDLRLTAVEQAKFLAPVGPGHILSVYAQAPEGWPGDWRFHLTADPENGGPALDAAFLKLQLEAQAGA